MYGSESAKQVWAEGINLEAILHGYVPGGQVDEDFRDKEGRDLFGGLGVLVLWARAAMQQDSHLHGGRWRFHIAHSSYQHRSLRTRPILQSVDSYNGALMQRAYCPFLLRVCLRAPFCVFQRLLRGSHSVLHPGRHFSLLLSMIKAVSLDILVYRKQHTSALSHSLAVQPPFLLFPCGTRPAT